MKKLSTLLLTGVVLGGTMLTNLMPVTAKVMEKESTRLECSTYCCAANKVDTEKSFIDSIKNSKNISDKEKQQLLNTEKELKPTKDKIKSLEDKLNAAHEKLMDPIFKKFEEIYSAHEDLWDKFYSDPKLDESKKDIISEIESSTVLNKKEKNILKEAQKKLDALNLELENIENKLNKETKSITDELNKLYDIVDKANEKNQKLLDKVFPPIALSENSCGADCVK